MKTKLYQERDIMELDKMGNYYSAHVVAMTTEGLHGKSDIAAELAYRDWRIAELEAQLADLTRHYNEALRDIEKRQSDNSLMLKSLIGYSRLCDDAGIDYSSDKLLAAYEKAIADKTVTGGE